MTNQRNLPITNQNNRFPDKVSKSGYCGLAHPRRVHTNMYVEQLKGINCLELNYILMTSEIVHVFIANGLRPLKTGVVVSKPALGFVAVKSEYICCRTQPPV